MAELPKEKAKCITQQSCERNSLKPNQSIKLFLMKKA